MSRWNDCGKCPYHCEYQYNWGVMFTEDCKAGLNPYVGCGHNRLVRWILFKIQQRKEKKLDKYVMKLLEELEARANEQI